MVGRWKPAAIKDAAKLALQMERREWTDDQIDEAVERGKRFAATNNMTGGSATRYVHPRTGRSVVIDDETNGVIMVGGDGFKF